MNYRDNNLLLLMSYGGVGFFMLPMVPITMTNCAECTYPVSEELAMGLLLVGANVMGFGLIFVMQSLIALNGSGLLLTSWFSAFYVGALLLQNIILMSYYGQYKRLMDDTTDERSNIFFSAQTPLLAETSDEASLLK